MQIGPNRRRARVVRAAVPRAPVVLEVLDRIDAPQQRDRQLAEGRPHEIGVAERPRGADLRGFLALVTRVDGQLALALQRDALAIEPARQDHPSVELAERRGVEGVGDGADRRAVGREDLPGFRAAPVRGRLRVRFGHG